MDPKPKVILNCRSSETLLPSLRESLQSQTHPFDLHLLQSTISPNRLCQIVDENHVYFFFDEDVELPTADYLKNLMHLFRQNQNLLFLGGCYLTHPQQPYLAKCYNTQIESWLLHQPQQNNGLVTCQNLPGGVWIISGQVKKHLHDWVEPRTWAGEDTFSIRWLQKKGIETFYHPYADVFHHPRSHLFHFCRRAYLQGRAREAFKLKSHYGRLNWNLIWKYRLYWPGWILHQLFVELGSLLFKIKSFKARTRPPISPIA